MKQAALHITNGESAVSLMRETGWSGGFLAWDDVLHVGPVPAGLSLDELLQVRAGYISGLGWGEYVAIAERFAARDTVLKSSAHFDKVVLWFESDRYDQLHILQIFDWFSEQKTHAPLVSMICTSRYLSECTPESFSALSRFEQPVSAGQLSLARRAWAAFRSTTPQPWFDLLSIDTGALPFLKDAIVRMLEEYPSVVNGLNRSAQLALAIVAAGESRAGGQPLSAQ
ncbi:MAG: hypothetical protein ACI9DC_000934 [Gammaproteobacteria bacterium]|jgi:hypothetical protein